MATGRGKLSGLLEDQCPFILVDSLSHIEGITLGASEEVDEVAGGASGMGVGRISEVGDRARERQAAGVFGAGFILGPLERNGARGESLDSFGPLQH